MPVTSVCEAVWLSSSIGVYLDLVLSLGERLACRHRRLLGVLDKVVSAPNDLAPYLPTGKLDSCAVAS